MGCYGVFFLILCQVILVFLGQPGRCRWIASRTDKRCEECSEWEEEWNERKERVCAGAEREVASSRAPAAQPGQQAAGSSSSRGREGTKHPENWCLQGHHETPILQLQLQCWPPKERTAVSTEQSHSQITSSIPNPCLCQVALEESFVVVTARSICFLATEQVKVVICERWEIKKKANNGRWKPEPFPDYENILQVIKVTHPASGLHVILFICVFYYVVYIVYFYHVLCIYHQFSVYKRCI